MRKISDREKLNKTVVKGENRWRVVVVYKRFILDMFEVLWNNNNIKTANTYIELLMCQTLVKELCMSESTELSRQPSEVFKFHFT